MTNKAAQVITKNKVLLATGVGDGMASIKSVSYTHLDVYKRQLQLPADAFS